MEIVADSIGRAGGVRHFYGLDRALVRMLAATTGSGSNRLVFMT